MNFGMTLFKKYKIIFYDIFGTKLDVEGNTEGIIIYKPYLCCKHYLRFSPKYEWSIHLLYIEIKKIRKEII